MKTKEEIVAVLKDIVTRKNSIDERVEQYKDVTNLKTAFGDSYIVRDDGTHDSQKIERIWGMEIPCRVGTIYPFGFNGDLAVWTKSRWAMRKLAELGLKCIQGGGFATECTYRFQITQFGAVAAIVKPRRKRKCHLSAEQKIAIEARLAPFRFKKKVANLDATAVLRRLKAPL